MTTGIHIFRKDLRIQDNLALHELSKKVDRVVGLFIYDTVQFSKPYHSPRAAAFLMDSVASLNQLCGNKLIIAHGDPSSILRKVIQLSGATHVSFNADYTPYAIQRDSKLKSVCKNIELVINYDDQTLIPMNQLTKRDGTPFMVFGAFFKNLQKHTIAKPVRVSIKWYRPAYNNYIPKVSKEVIPSMKYKCSDAGTHMAMYLNLGRVSTREAHHRGTCLRSLAWRDFFLAIYRFHPNGNSYTKYIDERYNQVRWPKVVKSEWNRLQSCNTGFLLVDAAMTQLISTGYINNRFRLILATFWIKYLKISPLDRTYGSQIWWSRLLMDCSGSQNKLNHQWVLGDLDISGRRYSMKGTHPLTGRMMRVDNGMISKFDPDYFYIREWLPQFSKLSVKECKQQTKNIQPMFDWKDRYMEYTRLFSRVAAHAP